MEFLFSVFTPTYNRANTIGRTYEYLCKQTLRSFEWIIVDDGSTDNTEEIVQKWINTNKISIVYLKQENGGKHRAFNRAVQIAKGEIFICLDSDDYYIETSLEIIYSYHLIHKDNPWIAGFSCNSLDLHGNLIGTSLPVDELVVSHYNLYNSLSVKGDKGLIYYTRILKEYPFPEFENEFFVTEALVLNRISLRYKICCIKRSLEIKDYQRDGLSSKYRHLCLRNPNGYALYINERNYFNLSFTNYVINAASYVRYSLFAGKSFRNIYKEAINRRWTFIIACFLGILLFIIDNLKGGGAERILITILQHLDAKKYNVDLFLINREGVYLDSVPRNICLYSALGDSNLLINKIKRRILLTFPSLFYIFHIRKLYDCYIAFREDTATRILFKAPATAQRVAWLHTDLIKHTYCKTTNKRRYFRDLPSLNQIVCVSKACQKTLINLCPAVKNKSIVLYNPIDISDIIQKSNVHINVPFSRDRINLLAVGRIDKGKNHRFLIECMPLLLNKGNFTLWILGVGPLQVELEKLRDDMGLQDYVHFLGFKENPYPLIKSCDVFVLSSLYEGLPTVIIEALILERNIVSSPCVGAEEVLCNGEFGYVASLDINSFSEAICKASEHSLLISTKLRHRLSDFDLNQQICKVNTLFR